MDKASIRKLVDYTQAMNAKVAAALDTLSEAQLTQPCDYSVGGVFEQARHMLLADWMGFHWVEGTLPPQDDPAYLKKEDFPDWPSVRVRWAALEREYSAWIDSLDDATLQEEVEVRLGPEKALRFQRWESIVMYINHATNHRAQVLRLLHDLGVETFEQGYFFWVMQHQMVDVG